jgi:polysaccharide deacetylase 2 family uncharacterized protein YibQ
MNIVRRRTVIAGLAGAAALPHQSDAVMRLLPPAAPPLEPPRVLAPPKLMPAWRRHAVAVTWDDPRPKIAVVVDDLGVMRERTEQTLALPGPLTLAWFPFAHRLPEQVAAGSACGHEAMLHMPMQANTNSILQTGPDPLRVDIPPIENLLRLKAALDAVPNIVGLNNHMGTVATRDAALMALVAQEIRARNMLFLDSLVIPHSQGIVQAEKAGVPAAARDVFIDNTSNASIIRGQLLATEATARRFGYAIAIGHPRPHTLAALEEWLPTLHGKGFVLWPLAATVALRNRMDWSVNV